MRSIWCVSTYMCSKLHAPSKAFTGSCVQRVVHASLEMYRASEVKCLSFLLHLQGDVWICMELLDSSMDKLSERVYHQLHSTIPEKILGKMSVAVRYPVSSLVY